MKSLPAFLAFALLTSACSKTVNEITIVEQKQQQGLESSAVADSSVINVLRQLLTSSSPNIALAELLARTLSEEHRESVRAMLAELSEEEALLVVNKVIDQNSGIRNNFLYHGQHYQNDSSFLDGVLLDAADGKGQTLSVNDQLRVATISYVKSKALNEIIAAYDKRVHTLAQELARNVAIDLARSGHRQAIEDSLRNKSQEDSIKQIQSLLQHAQTLDEAFRKSDLSAEDQYALLAGGIMAAAVYQLIKDDGGFQRVMREAKRIYQQAKDIEAKVKEFSANVRILNAHFVATEKNIRDLSSGLAGSRDDLLKLFRESQRRNNPDAGKIKDFLKNKVLLGKDANPAGTTPSILSNQQRINANLEKTVNAAGNLSNSLVSIINIAEQMGFKPSKDVQKVLDKAQKVNQIVNLAQSAMAGFATGGYLGVLSSLSSSSLLGGAASKDELMLGEINRKLDQVLDNQKKMMEMQVETMNMIKELAVMVDKYHQAEMAALADLRDLSLVKLEMNKALLNQDIRGCERMIDYQLKSRWPEVNFGSESFNSINQIGLIQSRFNSTITRFENIRGVTYSTEEEGFQKCQKGIAEAFGNSESLENPIRSIFSTNDQDNLMAWQGKKYLPLLNGLYYLSEVAELHGLPLHLVARDYETVKLKANMMEAAKYNASAVSVYEMDNLISVKALERYLVNMVVLLPYLDLDKGHWEGSYESIVANYLRRVESGNRTRTNFFLRNALKLTQSAIAQEALLAGEPLLAKLYEKHAASILSDAPCSDPELCQTITSARENKLLLRNFVLFTLRAQNDRSRIMGAYERAYVAKDKKALAALLNASISQDKIIISDNKSEPVSLMVGNQKVGLPTPQELVLGRVMYSENMPRLLNMQKVILDNLEKVSPLDRHHASNELLKLVFLVVQ
jgi:hypothetical protein